MLNETIGVELSQLLAATVALCFAVWAAYDIARGHRFCRNITLMAFFVFYALPVYLDLVLGRATYTAYPALNPARADNATSIVYSLMLFLVPPIIWVVNAVRMQTGAEPSQFRAARLENSWYRAGIYAACFGPVAFAIVSPARISYLEFGTVHSRTIDGGASITSSQIASMFHAMISFTGVFSVIFSAYLVGTTRRRLNPLIVAGLVLPALIAIWLNGKRYLVAYLIAIVFAALWMRRTVIGPKFFVIGLAMLVLLGGFSSWYQATVRSSDEWTFDRQYQSLRVDFGRDHNSRLAIYTELKDDVPLILEYRGQSALNYAFLLVPRAVWPEKPRTYGMYLTDAAIGVNDPSRTWTITTSILDEAIANFGALGIVIGPVILGVLSRIGDNSRSAIRFLTTVMVIIMFLTVHLSAFYPTFLFWLMLVAISHIRFKWNGQPIQQVLKIEASAI